MTHTRAVRTDGGFTLIEILVALTILGLVLTSVFGIIGRGLRAASRDEDRLLLALFAQNLLARSRLDLAARAGALRGTTPDGLHWSIESLPYSPPAALLAAAGGSGEKRDEARQTGPFGGEDASRFDRDDQPADNAEPAVNRGDPERTGAPERIRLRLVRVQVAKDEEIFELTSLAMEPRRERFGTDREPTSSP